MVMSISGEALPRWEHAVPANAFGSHVSSIYADIGSSWHSDPRLEPHFSSYGCYDKF